MKFALRDDDLNYFYNPAEIEKNYTGIWEICPVSMSVIPFVKGNWKNNIKILEEVGPGIMDKTILDEVYSDNSIYPIGDNVELIDFIKGKINENKIYLTIHGIHHRNEDSVLPQFKYNYGSGAEFYTTRDLTNKLSESIQYIENLFDQKVVVFTPPQNLINKYGLSALINNNLSICSSLSSLRKIDTISLYGLNNYLKLLYFRLKNNEILYPYPIVNRKIKIISHFSLQPGKDIRKIFKDFDKVYALNGNFVLSTHSYAFNIKMKDSQYTMGEIVQDLINYASTKKDVKFVNLSDCFN